MRGMTLLSLLVMGFILFGTFAVANVAQTTMTWFVASSSSISVSYGSPCASDAFFFVESNAQYDPDNDGNAARVVPSSTRAADANCQSSSQASIVVNSTGTAATNVDANFSSALAGADTNLVLKVWQGSAGCGTDGLGGWEQNCSVTSTTSAPNTSTCKNFNSSNWTAASRVITNLAAFGSTQLCFSGDFNSFVSSGDHNATFQLGSDFS